MSQRGEEEPLYGRISGRLLAQIHAGKFGAGEQLPSEAQLMRQFGVSRNTVRAAVQQLVDSGLVTRRRGSGTYVSGEPGIAHSLGSLRSLTSVIAELGLVPAVRDLQVGIDPSPCAEAVGFFQRDPIWFVSRTATASGQPFAVMDSWIPDDVGRALDKAALQADGSLYGAIAATSRGPVAEATETISAEAASAREAAALGVVEGSPLLVIRRFAIDRNGQPVEYGRSAARGDLYRYHIKLRALPSPRPSKP